MSPAPSLSLLRSIELHHATQINGKAGIGDHQKGLTLDHELPAPCQEQQPAVPASSGEHWVHKTGRNCYWKSNEVLVAPVQS